MRILVVGGDGYLGWPTVMHFSNRGFDVALVDNLSKRLWETELGVKPLMPIAPLEERVEMWQSVSGHSVRCYLGDITDPDFTEMVVSEERPDAIIHYGEQPSAPYSMRDRQHAVFTQVNNVVGTLNLVFAIAEHCPDTHIVKLGTMGEYGTPNIDIEEGYLSVEHNGRTDLLPYPKQPGSFYHLSKVHDSHNLYFVAKTWGLRVTDLNQGVVYGVSTPETRMHPSLATSCHYDETFGTVINRFMVQALKGVPLTVYGLGGQHRGFLNILDTLQCVELAVRNPAAQGDFRVFNQFTEQFIVRDLAERIQRVGARLGLSVEFESVPNPRAEKEIHYYRAAHQNLLDLGLQPHYLTDAVLEAMMKEIRPYVELVQEEGIFPKTQWKSGVRTP